MERLAEQIVDWHNRHPLARRIRAGDVHTVGVVALPFVRTSAPTDAAVEPVLSDAVSGFDALHGTPPVSRAAVWLQRLRALPARLLPARRGRTQWRAFSERFLPGLSPAQVERFALAHGFAEPPATPEARPWRVIVIDERLAGARGGWPLELYLMSAGIDAGGRHTRVLCGRGIPSQITGRRLWDPLRLGAAAGLAALLLALLAWWQWPRQQVHGAPVPAAAAAASAALAASAPVPPASAAVAASAPASAPDAALPALPALPAASLPDAAASDAEPPPDIRPRLVQRDDGMPRPPLLSSKPASAATAAAEKPAEKAPETLAEQAADKALDKAADPRLSRMAQAPGTPAVALVGPPGSKAEAEALLAKMKAGLAGVHGNPEALQADVIQTPEGWRATVWPFPSREQAQLINATLVARGLKTKAVNF